MTTTELVATANRAAAAEEIRRRVAEAADYRPADTADR